MDPDRLKTVEFYRFSPLPVNRLDVFQILTGLTGSTGRPDCMIANIYDEVFMRKKVYIAYTGGTIGMKRTADGFVPTAGYLERLMDKGAHR